MHRRLRSFLCNRIEKNFLISSAWNEIFTMARTNLIEFCDSLLSTFPFHISISFTILWVSISKCAKESLKLFEHIKIGNATMSCIRLHCYTVYDEKKFPVRAKSESVVVMFESSCFRNSFKVLFPQLLPNYFLSICSKVLKLMFHEWMNSEKCDWTDFPHLLGRNSYEIWRMRLNIEFWGEL